MMKNNFREPFNGISHLSAAVFAVFGLAFLVFRGWHLDFAHRVSLAVYGASLTLTFLSSGAYHSLNGPASRILTLRKIDHAAIYLLIAGTYTPICIILFTGFWRWGILTIVWAAAIVGMLLKVVEINKSDWIVAGIYLGAGWFSVIAAGEILRVIPPGGIILLFGGGLIYSLGAVLLSAKKLDLKPGVFGHHEIWHLFVIGGAFCHFLMIAIYTL